MNDAIFTELQRHGEKIQTRRSKNAHNLQVLSCGLCETVLQLPDRRERSMRILWIECHVELGSYSRGYTAYMYLQYEY